MTDAPSGSGPNTGNTIEFSGDSVVVVSGELGGMVSRFGDEGSVISGDVGNAISEDAVSIQSLDLSFIAAVSICAMSYISCLLKFRFILLACFRGRYMKSHTTLALCSDEATFYQAHKHACTCKHTNYTNC